MSAMKLGVTAAQLDGYIRTSEPMQQFASAISVIKKDMDYDKLSADQFTQRAENLSRAYRLEAIEIIHDIATIPMSGEEFTAAMAEVKLKAAIQLRGDANLQPVNNGQAALFAELNTIYQNTAPRIKSFRLAQVEFQDDK